MCVHKAPLAFEPSDCTLRLNMMPPVVAVEIEVLGTTAAVAIAKHHSSHAWTATEPPKSACVVIVPTPVVGNDAFRPV